MFTFYQEFWLCIGQWKQSTAKRAMVDRGVSSEALYRVSNKLARKKGRRA
jgi:hypothetical protein